MEDITEAGKMGIRKSESVSPGRHCSLLEGHQGLAGLLTLWAVVCVHMRVHVHLVLLPEVVVQKGETLL